MPHAAASLVRSLYVLRWIAVAGQALAVVFATTHLGLPLAAGPLWTAIGLLALFNLAVGLRLRRDGDTRPGEAFAHILLDTAVLAWLVAWSGGIANPFASLFLLPVAFAALTLPAAWAIAAAAAGVGGYLFAVMLARPLPHMHGDGLDLHLAGMAVNFLLSVVFVVYFLLRLATERDRRERELAALRERFARNEGIVALATHAASVAHELNTPLATMGLLLDELDAEPLPPQAVRDVSTLRQLVDTCSRRVRSLADPADPADPEHPATVDLDRLLDHWTQMRSTVALRRTGNLPPGTRLDRALGHLLLVLLNNAADAGEAAGEAGIECDLRIDGADLQGRIRDRGAGFDAHAPFLPVLFRTTKTDGLGVGLALSHAALEQLGGTLTAEEAEDGGAVLRFSAPRRAALPDSAEQGLIGARS